MHSYKNKAASIWAEMAVSKAVRKLYAGTAPSIRCFRGNVRVCFAVLISGDHVRKWEAECKTEQPRGLGHSLDQFLEQDVRRPEIIIKPAEKSCISFNLLFHTGWF